MRLSIFPLIFLCLGASAQAQQGDLHPVPESLPSLLFAPEPLAGTMLEPFGESQIPTAAGDDTVPPVETPSALPSVAQSPDAPPLLETAPETAPGAAEPTVAAPTTDPQTPAPTETGTAAPETAAPTGEALATPGTPTPTDEATNPEEAETATPEPAAPASGGSSTVHVIIENVESDAGVVNVAVCNTALSREGCPYDTQVAASIGFVETQFDDIPPGRYAVVGYHDENNNDIFDKFLGMPREPYALSSTAAEKLVPTFEDAALTIKEGDNFVIVRLQRFGAE